VNLATNVTGTLPVANGGTGAATLTANNVLLGNGTSAVQVVAPGTAGNVLMSNGTTWSSTTPTAQAYPGAGMAVSTGTAWATSKTTPTGDVVGTSDTQTLTNKTFGDNPAFSGGTANGVPYLNGSKVLTTGSALVFDGTNLGLGVTPSAWSSGKGFEIGAVGNGLWAGSGYTSIMQNVAFTSGAYRYVATATAARYEMEGNVFKWFTAPSGTAGNAISFTQAMTLDASGNLLVGQTSPTFSGSGRKVIEVQGSTDSFIAFGAGGSAIGYLYASATEARLASFANVPLVLFTNNTERMRIGTDGLTNLFVTNNDGLQSRSSTAAGTNNSTFVGRHSATGTSDGSISFVVWNNGNVVNTNNSYGSISDAKLKENVTDATPKLEKLNQVRIVNFNMIGDEQKQIGVIAQELEQIFPGMINEAPDKDDEGNDLGTTTKQVKYSVFVPMLVKAIQEQQAIITALTDRVEALESN
jgi:hypothetical protein